MNNIFKKFVSAVIVLSMLVTMTACGGGSDTPATPDTTNPTTPTAAPAVTAEPESTNSVELVMMRQAMIGTTDLAAIAYLGTYFEYYDLYDYSQIEEYIESTGLYEDLPFLAEVDAEHFVPHIGGQLFYILPADENATVTIYDMVYNEETYETEYGDVLYSSENGEPVIVMGNESEYIPNLIVEIYDSEGNILEYIPCLSGEDGRLEEAYDVPTIWDISNYDKLGYVSENNYTFDPALLYYAEDWTAFVPTINDDEVAVGFWFGEDGEMEMCYEVYGGNGYEVYYEGYWYPADEGEYYAECPIIFDLSLVEDTSDLQIARDQIYTVMSFEYDSYTDSVFMMYEDYDYLLDVESELYYTLYTAVG